MALSASHPVTKLRRRAGRVRRYVKRKWWERNIGKEYKAWLEDSRHRAVGSIDNAIPISVIVPVYNPPVLFLKECLASAVNQTAEKWQLIVSDDGSTDAAVKAFLTDFAAEHSHDPRVLVIRDENEGISAAQNRALDYVRHDYFGWLDHDDQLNPRAIELMSVEISSCAPKPQVVYSDEDKIDSKGEHYELYCKPDFSPELLLTQMYLCHFTVFDTELVRQHRGFDSNMDGAQDFDLALRLLPKLTNVQHIPKPLYHWRAWSQSTASSIDAKPWAQDAARRAQQRFLDRGSGGTARPSAIPGLNEIHPRLEGSPTVSVVIPTAGTMNATRTSRLVDDAVRTLRESEPETELQIIAVTTGEIAPISGVDEQVIYEPTGNFNFAEAVNLGRRHADGEYLFLLNDDTTADFSAPITRMLELAQRPGVGAVGAKLSYPDGRLQHAGIVLLPSGPTHVHIARPAGFPGYFGSTLTPRNFLAVTAAAMLTPVGAFDEVNGFDTRFARDFNDVDFCLRLRDVGYRIAWTPYAHLTHHEGASIVRKAAHPSELAEFQRRWSSKYAIDPFYSPSLNPNLERMYEAL